MNFCSCGGLKLRVLCYVITKQSAIINGKIIKTLEKLTNLSYFLIFLEGGGDFKPFVTLFSFNVFLHNIL